MVDKVVKFNVVKLCETARGVMQQIRGRDYFVYKQKDLILLKGLIIFLV
jgi:hypothetical protein